VGPNDWKKAPNFSASNRGPGRGSLWGGAMKEIGSGRGRKGGLKKGKKGSRNKGVWGEKIRGEGGTKGKEPSLMARNRKRGLGENVVWNPEMGGGSNFASTSPERVRKGLREKAKKNAKQRVWEKKLPHLKMCRTGGKKGKEGDTA